MSALQFRCFSLRLPLVVYTNDLPLSILLILYNIVLNRCEALLPHRLDSYLSNRSDPSVGAICRKLDILETRTENESMAPRGTRCVGCHGCG